jgi:hypothetical protein
MSEMRHVRLIVMAFVAEEKQSLPGLLLWRRPITTFMTKTALVDDRGAS